MDWRLVHKYISFVEKISDSYHYDTNIRHLLYLIIPAFVTKYSIYKEELILHTFRDVPIIISHEKSDVVKAFYTSIPQFVGDKILTKKYIVLQDYNQVSLVQLLDNLVHEFNHAINSYQKEIVIQNNILYLRTGLSYAKYDVTSLDAIGKDDSYILEEILNTHQTEEIINYIKNYHDMEHVEFNHTIDAINHETNLDYQSSAYYLENTLMKDILNNKTFISTLNNLRMSGDVLDISDWFNHITGDRDSYQKLIQYLKEIMSLEEKYTTQKFFRNRTIEKIKDCIRKLMDIINIFNQNCNYK